MADPNSYLITSPIYYVNAQPHVGHAYTTVLTDIIARRQRLNGLSVLLTTGTDEHGAKVAEVARGQKKTPKRFVDEQAELFKIAWQALGISYDDFIRTTEPRHEQAVELFLRQLKASGAVYEGVYEGLYCTGCEAFVDPGDLQDGLCPFHNRVPETVKEKNWFFQLSKYRDELVKRITNDKIIITPEVRKREVLSFLARGLKDISISRENQPWGIPLPFDPKQTVYVWVDALINYLTVAGFGADKAKQAAYWPAACHIIGKDILRFHCVIWPALLLAVGLEPPRQIFVHGFFTIDGQKMSKTLGNVIAPEDLVAKFGPEGARYVLVRHITPGEDTDIGLDKFSETYNAELKNGVGNLFARVLKLAQKTEGFVISVPEKHTATDLIRQSWVSYHQAFNNFNLAAALEQTQRLVAWSNRSVDTEKPWTINRPDELAQVLAPILEVLRHIGLQLLPFTPRTAGTILKHLGVKLPANWLPSQFAAFEQWTPGVILATPATEHLFS